MSVMILKDCTLLFYIFQPLLQLFCLSTEKLPSCWSRNTKAPLSLQLSHYVLHFRVYALGRHLRF